jgi:hypothetical protein
LTIPGPNDIPFESSDVRVYIDTLFLEGLLQPVESVVVAEKENDWFLVGIRRDPQKDRVNRFLGLLQTAEKQLPSIDDRHDTWLSYAQTWAHLGMTATQLNRPLEIMLSTRWDALRTRMDSIFIRWLLKRYGALHNLPTSPPVLVHHIPRHLANLRSSSMVSKLALVVIDGLVLWSGRWESNPRLKIANLLIHWEIDVRRGPKRSRMACPERKMRARSTRKTAVVMSQRTQFQPTS